MVGPGGGTLEYLPEQHTDFKFDVFWEPTEFSVLLALVLVGLGVWWAVRKRRKRG